MPELPEVETIVRTLSPALLGRNILAVAVRWPGCLHGISARSFTQHLRGASIANITRRGKFLQFALSRKGRSRHMLLHLRMSGRLELRRKTEPEATHDRLIFKLNNGMCLCFNDTRKFGRVYLVSSPSEVTDSLGPEPLSRELSEKVFFNMIRLKNAAIKPLLLNQTFLAGVGNIYADESLWRAGIHPLRRSAGLSRPEVRRLLRAIRFTLSQAIRFHGTDAGDGVVDFGRYKPMVYGQTDAPCPRCRKAIRRMVVAQRGTHYCPYCQKARP